MPDSRPPSRRAGLAALAILVVSAGLGLAMASDQPAESGSAPRPAVLSDTLLLDVRYAGIGAEGVDLVWRGLPRGAVQGQASLRIAYAGDPADRGMPIWPVNAWLLFAAADPRSSFAAELSGSMNWRTGEMRVTGLVSDGARRDAAVEQRMRVQPPGLAGIVRVVFHPRLSRSGSPSTEPVCSRPCGSPRYWESFSSR